MNRTSREKNTGLACEIEKMKGENNEQLRGYFDDCPGQRPVKHRTRQASGEKQLETRFFLKSCMDPGPDSFGQQAEAVSSTFQGR